MGLHSITISGVDDKTDLGWLVGMTEQYRDLVEWGVLVSRSREGEPRYPTTSWRAMFMKEMEKVRGRASMHLCGAVAREMLAGNSTWFTHALIHGYDRMQLNGYHLTNEFVDMLASDPPYPELILQVRSFEQLREAEELQGKVPVGRRISALWDRSGGRGKPEEVWPDPAMHFSLGYAGSIGPDNIVSVMRTVGMRTIGWRKNRFWLDMESGVRTDDRLDYEKVRRVLEACKALDVPMHDPEATWTPSD